MRNIRLFERICGWPEHPGGRNRSRVGDQVSSVITHLIKLLNSRQGSTLMNADYGMPDFTDLRATFPDSVRDIERSISLTIERFEPRLESVNVTFMEQDERLTLYFQIRARLKFDGESRDIHLQSTLDTGGKMAVRR